MKSFAPSLILFLLSFKLLFIFVNLAPVYPDDFAQLEANNDPEIRPVNQFFPLLFNDLYEFLRSILSWLFIQPENGQGLQERNVRYDSEAEMSQDESTHSLDKVFVDFDFNSHGDGKVDFSQLTKECEICFEVISVNEYFPCCPNDHYMHIACYQDILKSKHIHCPFCRDILNK